MISWLIRFEAFPEYFTSSLAGYRSILSKDVLVMDSWMKIMFEGIPIGYSHTSSDVNEFDPAQHYMVNNEVHLRLKIMGKQQNVHLNTLVHLDAMYEIRKFSFSLSSGGYPMHINAERETERTFNVEIVTGNSTERTKIDIPNDVVLYSPMTEMSLRRLKPGRQVNIRTLNPVSMQKVNLLIRALRKEPLVLAGKEYQATVLAMEYEGMEIFTWIDSRGNILRQETPIGWTMEKCTMEEAFETIEAPDGGKEIWRAMSGWLL